MIGLPVGALLEIFVALLLAVTVGYCISLNRKLSRLRSHQDELREVIGQLESATLNAEQAIRGLKVTADEADRKLTGNLDKAKRLSDELAVLVRAGGKAGAAGAPVRERGLADMLRRAG